MAKRHTALRTLSSDHHRALVLAKHLRAAGEAAAARQALAERILAAWPEELEPHFAAEEAHLLPLYARHATPAAPEIAETWRQHVQLRMMVDALREQLERAAIPPAEALRTLGDALRDHVRYEENTLFPAVEAVLPAEQLQRLGGRLAT